MSGPHEGRPRGPGRVVGVDLGAVRIGLAASDSERRIAMARGVITRSGRPSADHDAIAALVDELGATLVVVGLPLSLSGANGPAARLVLEEVEVLRLRLAVPVETVDERFSSLEATKRRAPGTRPGRRRGGAPRRPIVDDMAAAIFLQAWIDRSANAS